MRVFDSQKRVVWQLRDGTGYAPLKLSSSSVASAFLPGGTVRSIKVIGRNISGDGWVILQLKDKAGLKIFSKTFKFSKKSSTEISFMCNIVTEGCFLEIVRTARSRGRVVLERIIADGNLYTEGASPKRAVGASLRRDAGAMTVKAEGPLSTKKVAVIVPYGIYGGGEVYLENILSAHNSSFAVDLLALSKNSITKKLEGSVSAVKTLNGTAGLKGYLGSSNYDIIVYYNSKKVYDILVECKTLGVLNSKLVEVYHSNFIWADAIAKIKKREFIDRLIVVSKNLGKDIEGVGDSKRLHIPVGIDTERFSGGKSKELFVKKGYEKVIGTVARLSPEKNIDYILSIAKKIPNYLFVVVGTGPQELALKRRVKDESIKNIELVGYKTNVEDYYRAFDGFLLTSKVEGTPISIIEAMASGLPIFTTAVGEIESLCCGLDGVSFLTKDLEHDVAIIKDFIFKEHDKESTAYFAAKNHNIEDVRKMFFQALSGSFSSVEVMPEKAETFRGDYI